MVEISVLPIIPIPNFPLRSNIIEFSLAPSPFEVLQCSDVLNNGEPPLLWVADCYFWFFYPVRCIRLPIQFRRLPAGTGESIRPRTACRHQPGILYLCIPVFSPRLLQRLVNRQVGTAPCAGGGWFAAR